MQSIGICLGKNMICVAIVVMAMMVCGCSNTKKLVYFNTVPRNTVMSTNMEFSKGIQCNDLLNIYVESISPEATRMFNQETNKIAIVDGTPLNQGSTTVSGYLVDQNGDITFPVLGKIHVLGMTHDALAKELRQRLVDGEHIKDATVSVRLMNFKVCILGEVAQPGVVMAEGERMTILEALSMAGDITIYGMRNNVTVIREENGSRVVGEIDLTSKDVFDSPYYYLHQNDVVYVEPNAKRKSFSDRDPMTLQYVTAAVTIVSLLTSAFYYYLLASKIM